MCSTSPPVSSEVLPFSNVPIQMPTTLTHNDICDPGLFLRSIRKAYMTVLIYWTRTLYTLALLEVRKSFLSMLNLFSLTGVNELYSNRNMLNWLHKVAKDYPLPCTSFPSGLKNELIKGCFQNLRQDELDKFIKHLQTKMMVWGAMCCK